MALLFQVDIFQMYILEFMDRPDCPLYHCEHFIEGDYIKYNSNSGFVEENLRYTPQVGFFIRLSLAKLDSVSDDVSDLVT